MTDYDQAHAAHQDAVKRGDTRSQHRTGADLRAAMTERLKVEAAQRQNERVLGNLGSFMAALRRQFGAGR